MLAQSVDGTRPDSQGTARRFAVDRTAAADGTVGVTVSGDVDLATVHRLSAVLNVLPDEATRAVVVDLSAVPFCCARTAEALHRLLERTSHRGIPLRLVSTSQAVRRCFDVFGLTAALHVPSQGQ